MGALSRGREAVRFRAVVKAANALNDVDADRLEVVIQAYEDGSAATDERGEVILDKDGEEVSESDIARTALTENEVKAIERFCASIRDKTVPDVKGLLKAAELATELPSGFPVPGSTAHDMLLDLIEDIVGSIP